MRLFGRNVAWAFCIAVAASVAGCSVHPLPDDVSRETTISIIQNIRCEAKGEILRKVHALFLASPSAIVRSMHPEMVLGNLEAIRRSLETIRRHDPQLAAKIDRYQATTIGYIFQFMITEKNNDSVGAQFFRPFGSSDTQFNLQVGAGVAKSRVGERNIEVIEHFNDMGRLDCTGTSDAYRNLAYPITGSIGMDEIVDTFLRLGESGAGRKSVETGIEGFRQNVTFVDNLKFTTKVVAGIAPKIVLDAVPGSFRLVEASGDFSAERTDFHQLTVTMTFPVTVEGTPVSARVLRTPGDELDEIMAATKRKAAEELCIQRALNREELTGVASLTPPEEYCRGGKL